MKTPCAALAGDNTGWTPNQTLAGTRFRTKLGDLATQMEVFTMDFMDDFGFTSVEQTSVYSLKYVARNCDFFTGASLTTMRMIPRQFVYSCEVDL